MGVDNFFVIPYETGLLRAVLKMVYSDPPFIIPEATASLSVEIQTDEQLRVSIEIEQHLSPRLRPCSTIIVYFYPLVGQLAMWDGSRYRYGEEDTHAQVIVDRLRDTIQTLRRTVSTATNDRNEEICIDIFGDPCLPIDYVDHLKGTCIHREEDIEAELPEQMTTTPGGLRIIKQNHQYFSCICSSGTE